MHVLMMTKKLSDRDRDRNRLIIIFSCLLHPFQLIISSNFCVKASRMNRAALDARTIITI